MSEPNHTYVILLRAIGPVTHRLMGMAQWREAAAAAGFLEPRTVLNTGNMIAGFAGSTAAAGKTMRAVLAGFGLGENVVPILRSPAALRRIIKANPLPDAAAHRASQTGVFFFASARPDLGWIGEHEGPEAMAVVAGHLVVNFSDRISAAGRLIRQIDKRCGVNTSRSWSSLGKIVAAL
jgi:uncharacterized protein (DUF1697 family)